MEELNFMDELEERLYRKIYRDALAKIQHGMWVMFWVLLGTMGELIGSMIIYAIGGEVVGRAMAFLSLVNMVLCIVAILVFAKKRDDVEHEELKRQTGA